MAKATHKHKRVRRSTKLRLAESNEKAALLALERYLVHIKDYYAKAPWQPASTTNLFWIRNAERRSHCYGDKTMLVITGSGTSDLDIAFFRENYIARAFQGTRTTLMTTRYRTVDSFVMQSDALDTLRAIFQSSASEEEVSRIREHLKSTFE